MSALKVMPVSPAGYGPAWNARWLNQTHGARCCYCNREIAVTPDLAGKHVACFYCGIDRQELPAEERPL